VTKRVLVLNAGSSSLKASVLETPELRTVGRREVSLGADATVDEARRRSVQQVLSGLEQDGVDIHGIDAVGHRVVHGGTQFRDAVRIDQAVLKGIEELAEFAPLHNLVASHTIRAAIEALPGVPQVASFDTAFHASLPVEAFAYPVPEQWSSDWGVRRFGFHGLSVTWSSQRTGALLRRPSSELALLVAHLGSGCSVSAVLHGRSVNTSMGLTPMEGLMMGTRSGSIDPGILLYVLRTGRADWKRLEEDLDHHSGLVGVSGRAVGMKELEQAAQGGDARAALAVEMFVRHAAAGIAAMATELPRVDALVFTGGIGENAAGLRSKIMERLKPMGFPGVGADPVAEDRVLSRPVDRPAVLRIEAREDAVIAQEAAALLDRSTV
jgi:acetate kinase